MHLIDIPSLYILEYPTIKPTTTPANTPPKTLSVSNPPSQTSFHTQSYDPSPTATIDQRTKNRPASHPSMRIDPPTTA